MLPDTFHNKTACCFTGHRAQYLPQSPVEKVALVSRLRQCIAEAVALGVTRFLAGGADGFDTVAAEAVLYCKRFSPQLSLVLALPSKTQANGWREPMQQRYLYILEHASEVFYCSERDNSAFAMRARNRYLVDHADCCIAYCTRPSGGTVYTLNYALDRGLPIYNLAEALQ